MRCNKFFRRDDYLILKEANEEVFILESVNSKVNYYFLADHIYHKLKEDQSLQNKHLATAQDSINVKQFKIEQEQQDLFELRKGQAIYSSNPNELNQFFQQELHLPLWHQNRIGISVKGKVNREGKLKTTDFNLKKLEQALKDQDKIQIYIDEINRAVDLMTWLPKLSKDSIPIASKVNFRLSLYHDGPQYHEHFGIHKVKDYFDNNLIYPEWHKKWQAPTFEIYMTATVDTAGKLKNIKVMSNGATKHFKNKDKIAYYAKEAIRAAENMDAWIPQKDQEGHPIDAQIGFFATF